MQIRLRAIRFVGGGESLRSRFDRRDGAGCFGRLKSELRTRDRGYNAEMAR
jgi:hypothetical protein